MTEDRRFDELMRDAAQTFRSPPPAPDFDAMWSNIEQRALATGAVNAPGVESIGAARVSRHRWWLAIAATLVLGVALGRASMSIGRAPAVAPQTAAVPAPHADSVVAVASNGYGVETSRYLGQTAALLIALPSETRAGRTNREFVNRAGELLTTTRLLLDSPASNDPAMHDLLEDLELVLAQVVRLQDNNSRTEVDLINRALEQRDVIPRLRTAAGDYSAN